MRSHLSTSRPAFEEARRDRKSTPDLRGLPTEDSLRLNSWLPVFQLRNQSLLNQIALGQLGSQCGKDFRFLRHSFSLRVGKEQRDKDLHDQCDSKHPAAAKDSSVTKIV